jgi:predicted DNA-binding transcriptional regulator AlpA
MEEKDTQNRPLCMLTLKEALRRTGLGRTAFDRHYVKTGLIKKVKMGPRAARYEEGNVNAAIAARIAAAAVNDNAGDDGDAGDRLRKKSAGDNAPTSKPGKQQRRYRPGKMTRRAATAEK